MSEDAYGFNVLCFFVFLSLVYSNGRQIVNCHRYKTLFVIVATWPMSLDIMHWLFTLWIR